MTAGWDWRPFEEAREFVRGLGFKNLRTWHEWAKSGERPADIPTNPHTVYKGEGWVDWGDWLGTNYVAHKNREYRPFEEARAFARGLGLKGAEKWHEWTKTGDKPADIPSNPNKVYKGKGWAGWGDWLGTGKVQTGVL